MKKTLLFVALAALLLLGASVACAEPLLRAAIFVQNRGGEELQSQVDSLSDHLSASLTEKGFSIIDRNVVLAKFRESRAEVARNLKKVEELKLKKDEATVEDAFTGASALRVAQMLGADYLVMATITSLGKETKTFKGNGTAYGSDNESTTYNLRISLKVLEGGQGGSVYGDTVTASERIVTSDKLSVDSSDILPKLIETGARRIADNVAGKVERVRNVQIKPVPVVEFTVNSNVEGAVVELDGAVLGSTPGHFAAAPGLHQLRISKEWLSTWERTVNLNSNQELNVTLELSEEGMRRYTTIEALKVELAQSKERHQMEMKEREAKMGMDKEQSEAEAYSKKKVAEGEKTRREESHERVEGAPATNLDK